MSEDNKKIKVSVCVITFNQDKYISECLQSIMDQEVDFAFEVIIGDDCSVDKTQAIIKKFAARYPEIIKPIFHEKNMGNCSNLIWVYGKARGEYIAHMDGDDFMLPGKLRIQAEELDRNSDCAMCVHPVKEFDQRNQRFCKFRPIAVPRKSDLSFLLMNLPFFTHSSKMFRAKYHKGLESLTGEFFDCYLHIHHALKGKILYLNDVLGVYRLNAGVSAAINNDNSDYIIFKSKMLQLALEAIEYAGRNGVREDIIRKAKAKIYFEYAHYYLMVKDFKKFNLLLNRSIETAKLGRVQLLFKCFSKAPYCLFLAVRLRKLLRGIS